MRMVLWMRRIDHAANDLFIAIEDVLILGYGRLDAISRALDPDGPLAPAKAPIHDDTLAEPRPNPVAHGRWT